MTARVIDGKAYAAKLRGLIGEGVEAFKSETGHVPGLAVVLVGEDPASRVYVANKAKQKFPNDPQVDKIIADTIKKWRFKPFIVGSKPVKTCSERKFRIKFNK